MTSRRPYWCPKTMKRRPCWCPKPVLWELNSFLTQTLSFVPINLHRCRSREWKHSIASLLQRLCNWRILGRYHLHKPTQEEILCRSKKLLAWWEYYPLQNMSKFTEQTKKSGKIASPQTTAHNFWSFPNGMAWTIGLSNQNWRPPHINGK